MNVPVVSALVRTKDSASTVERTFRSLRTQDVPVEIVVIDSGSKDETLDIARAWADRVLSMAPDDFTFGGALNRAADVATAPVHLALSSHCVLPRPDLARRAAVLIAGGATAAFGERVGPDGHPLTAPLRLDYQALVSNRFWGYSNHAGAWSASAWEEHPFSEVLRSSEDREWSWRAISAGGYHVADPLLFVPSGHRRSAGALSYYRRMVKEGTALLEWRPLPPYSAAAAARDLAAPRPGTAMMTASRPLGRTRLIEVAARVAAARYQRRTFGSRRHRPS